MPKPLSLFDLKKQLNKKNLIIDYLNFTTEELYQENVNLNNIIILEVIG